MGKIYVIMAKSATGKDTMYEAIKERAGKEFKKVVEYTTRPMRENETAGQEHYFVDEAEFEKIKASGKLIEYRVYQTMHGPWYYFNVDDGQFDLKNNDYLLITTVEAYVNIRKYFGEDAVVPLYLEVSDKTRIHRALKREDEQSEPKYAEMCRRFLADNEDYSDEKLNEAGITVRYSDEDFEKCLGEILAVISGN